MSKKSVTLITLMLGMMSYAAQDEQSAGLKAALWDLQRAHASYRVPEVPKSLDEKTEQAQRIQRKAEQVKQTHGMQSPDMQALREFIVADARVEGCE